MSDSAERYLWRDTDSPRLLKRKKEPTETFASIYEKFASYPPRKSLWQLCSRSHVVVQETSLTFYVLARHRVLIEANERRYILGSVAYNASTCLTFAALLVVLVYGSHVETKQDRKAKVQQRLIDGILSATLLRLMASLLQSLTASYASDTLYTLAVAGLALHVFACDYSYANGNTEDELKASELNASNRLLFQGGTVSLNSALFSTTLLVSRLGTSEAYFFIYFAIALFGFYPVTRNSIATIYQANASVALWLVTLLVCLATLLLLESPTEALLFATVLVFIGVAVPFWRFVEQKYKTLLTGPWDIPTRIS